MNVKFTIVSFLLFVLSLSACASPATPTTEVAPVPSSAESSVSKDEAGLYPLSTRTGIADVNLEEAVEKGEFRVDLYFRLNAFSVPIPPLRERGEDIPLLAEHFLRIYSERYKKSGFKTFSPETMEMLVSYRWPGNVRELRNVIERIVVLEQEEVSVFVS